MAVPRRLTLPPVVARHASMVASLAGRQTGRGASNRFHQAKRGDAASKRQFDGPGTFDADDWWVDEYEGPLGRGWVLSVSHVVRAQHTDSGEAETWIWTHHVGPETRSIGWRQLVAAA